MVPATERLDRDTAAARLPCQRRCAEVQLGVQFLGLLDVSAYALLDGQEAGEVLQDANLAVAAMKRRKTAANVVGGKALDRQAMLSCRGEHTLYQLAPGRADGEAAALGQQLLAR